MRLGNLQEKFKNKEFKTAVITAAALLSIILVVFGGYIVKTINDSGNEANLTGVIVPDDDDYDDSLAAENGYNLEGHNCLDVFSQEEYEKRLAAQDSDIDGWTQLDKYNAGLLPQDGSDTDWDGLTDKEEIEVYGSDPLKKSTAGDLYTDSYKVEHGMDLFTYYEYDQEIVFKNNKCPEILFEADSVNDLSAYAENYDLSGENISESGQFMKNYTVYKTYLINNYTGVLGFDLSQIASENGVKALDLEIFEKDWFENGTDPQKVDNNEISRYGNIIYVGNDDTCHDMTVYCVVKKTYTKK